MESMPQLATETLDKVAPDLVMREKCLEKCSKKFGGFGSFPPLNDEVILETSGARCYTDSEWVDSEDGASACSLESDASSNAISGNSLVSDADSLAPLCEEKIVKKCPSGGSIVTYDEAVSKLNDEGERKAADVRHRRGEGYQTDGQFDEQDTSINTAPRMAESAGKAWTDDKHCSYLNSMEATFVRSLYEQDYRTVDMSEQDHDCVESRPIEPAYLTYNAGGELFTSLQRGCYDQREYYRPHYLFAPSAPAVFASPWIQHFNPRIAPQAVVAGGSQDELAGHTSSTSGFAEGIHCSNYMYQGVMEEVMESVPVIPDVPQVSQGWNNRYQSQLNASTSAPIKPDASIQAKKRACNLDSCTDGLYRPKKLKSTQLKLAKTDLELEEQFVLEQLNQREDANRLDIREGRCRLDGSSNDVHRLEREAEQDRNGSGLLQDTPSPQSAANGKQTDGEEMPAKKEPSNVREPEEETSCRGSSGKQRDCDIVSLKSVLPGRKDSSEKPVDCPTSSLLVNIGKVEENSARKDTIEFTSKHHAGVREIDSGLNVVDPAARHSAASGIKIARSFKCQLDAGNDENDECNFVGKKSPRACHTYTCGLLGTRRPLLSGNAIENREDGSTGKER